ncbi:hypothetical protein [Actinoplanes sp. URMC 104]|uniref:hypothetical protein n=1 Tax=Actinoplanes sp. URMC 104 TaxID=3423409 RepID=UPI003F19D913
MTLANVTADRVLHLIQQGCRTRLDLADRLGVLPAWHQLEDVIDVLKAQERVVEAHGYLHAHDLLEDLED